MPVVDESVMHKRKVAAEVTEEIKRREAERTSHMFKSQSERFMNKADKSMLNKKFEAELFIDGVYVSEGASGDMSTNKSKYVTQNNSKRKMPKVGFNSLSPRFGNTKETFKPGPGEYIREIDSEDKPREKKSTGVFKGSTRNHHSNLANVMKTSKSIPGPTYMGHETLVKKSYNKLLSPREY